mgnify:FL=1
MDIIAVNNFLKSWNLILDDSVHNVTGTYYLRDIDFKKCSDLNNFIEREATSIGVIESDIIPFNNIDDIKSELTSFKWYI